MLDRRLRVPLLVYGDQERESLEEYQGRVYIRHPVWHCGRSWISVAYAKNMQRGKPLPGMLLDRVHNFGDRYFIDDFDLCGGDVIQVNSPDCERQIQTAYFIVTSLGHMVFAPFLELRQTDLAQPQKKPQQPGKKTWGRVRT